MKVIIEDTKLGEDMKFVRDTLQEISDKIQKQVSFLDVVLQQETPLSAKEYAELSYILHTVHSDNIWRELLKLILPIAFDCNKSKK